MGEKYYMLETLFPIFISIYMKIHINLTFIKDILVAIEVDHP